MDINRIWMIAPNMPLRLAVFSYPSAPKIGYPIIEIGKWSSAIMSSHWNNWMDGIKLLPNIMGIRKGAMKYAAIQPMLFNEMVINNNFFIKRKFLDLET